MGAQVSLRHLTKRYGRSDVLADVTVELDHGITGLLGPNGAGKTTLLRIIATALAPTAGTVQVLGRDPQQPGPRVEIRRRLGYVPQELGLYENFTAFEFVDYVAILKEHHDRRARHDEVRRVLSAIDLTDVSAKKIRKLSGGMRRRIMLAQALLGQPELLVLDEPTVGLDPEHRLRFRHLISQYGEARCVVLSTHLTDDVEALCDRVIVLQHGAVTFDGTPAGLADLAAGHVWVADRPDPSATVSWRTPDGGHRHVGSPPPDAQLLAPTIQDGYLLLTGPLPIESAA